MKGSKNPSPIRMEAVAKKAGVSRSTVSRALRNHPSIPFQTCQRIQNIAHRMGYRPNPLVSSLMAQLQASKIQDEKLVLGLLVDQSIKKQWEGSKVYHMWMRGARRRSEELGYMLEEFWWNEQRMSVDRLTKILETRSISGVLVPTSPVLQSGLTLDWARFAVATIGYVVEGLHLHRSSTDHFHGMSVVMEKLMQRGYQRIGFAMGAQLDRIVNHRWLGAYTAYQCQLSAKKRLVPHVCEAFDQKAFWKWMREEKPDVIICCQRHYCDWLKEEGMQIPKDVGVAYLNVDPRHRELAGINQNADQVGAAAIDLIVDQLNKNQRGIPQYPKTVSVEGYWVDGKSIRLAK